MSEFFSDDEVSPIYLHIFHRLHKRSPILVSHVIDVIDTLFCVESVIVEDFLVVGGTPFLVDNEQRDTNLIHEVEVIALKDVIGDVELGQAFGFFEILLFVWVVFEILEESIAADIELVSREFKDISDIDLSCEKVTIYTSASVTVSIFDLK